jgi:hypothetical protein
MGAHKRVTISHKHNFNKLIVEGDSQVILNLFQKVLNSVDPEKISPCWRLSHGLRKIATLLRPSQAFIPSHVRRKENQIVDELANIGIEREGPDLLVPGPHPPDAPYLSEMPEKISSHRQLPGWGDSGRHLSRGEARREPLWHQPRDGCTCLPLPPP